MKETVEFTAIDTLFFKEARPMETPGSTELGSLFPPPIRTLAGAIRSSIAEDMGVDWAEFHENNQPEIENIIGNSESTGTLKFKGPWLHYCGQRLYPAPLNLAAKYNETGRSIKEREQIIHLAAFTIGDAHRCDLAKNGSMAALPCLPAGMEGCKALQNHWLTTEALELVLAGQEKKINTSNAVVKKINLYKDEHRLGIARDNRNGMVKEGLLYQTRHLRLTKDTSVCLDLEGHENLPGNRLIKLGGEGRMAMIQTVPKPDFPKPPQIGEQTCQGVILYLLTPLLLKEGDEFLPGFSWNEREKISIWKGELNKIPLVLISAVLGKVQREGGWDMAKHQPRPVRSFIPAGSAFYCEVEDNNVPGAMKALHNTLVGEETNWGYGHIATGLWLAKTTKGCES